MKLPVGVDTVKSEASVKFINVFIVYSIMQQLVEKQENKVISELMGKKKKREAEIIEAPRVLLD